MLERGVAFIHGVVHTELINDEDSSITDRSAA